MALYMHSTILYNDRKSFHVFSEQKFAPNHISNMEYVIHALSCHPSSTSFSAEKLALGVHSGEAMWEG